MSIAYPENRVYFCWRFDELFGQHSSKRHCNWFFKIETSDSNPTEFASRAPEPKSAPTAEPEVWLEQHGNLLFKFALLRVRDAHTAEDLVQETLVKAFAAFDKLSRMALPRLHGRRSAIGTADSAETYTHIGSKRGLTSRNGHF